MDLSGIFKYYCKECENTWNNSSVELFENIETYSKDSQKKREKYNISSFREVSK